MSDLRISSIPLHGCGRSPSSRRSAQISPPSARYTAMAVAAFPRRLGCRILAPARPASMLLLVVVLGCSVLVEGFRLGLDSAQLVGGSISISSTTTVSTPATATTRGMESTTRSGGDMDWRGGKEEGQPTWGRASNSTASCSIEISSGDQRACSSSSRGRFLRNHAAGFGLGLAAAGLPAPAHALLEDFKKEGKCPAYKAVDNFDIDKYMGIWYELAYHDWTQIKICGCTRFNMTRTSAGGLDGPNGGVKDAFTTKCPYAEDAGETFLINMREVVDSRTPGSFKEYAFYNKWDNKVVALWRSSDGQYERAIQLQCVEVLGRRAFVGINFLSREPIVPPSVLSDMFRQARALGLAGIGGSPAEMELVRHEGCRYPTSSGNRESRSWGSAWGVNTLAL